ncbi:DUF1801 domain-containing protein [Rhodocytophaga rosea]|uniref:DUF1801 domain-containing protein n=1 Tax=Rhodocytophaga rosea TaxID=2704465 RepID=A0A6C0GPK5_9BACT|nr:DUF1801 domain-containing protein [Rhodocytophaga rosea]QHT69961.1 DUF1801 domain-containing protein [Rhodocytophaga rosea]
MSEKIKPKKLTGHQQVLTFLHQLEHPLKPEIEMVRSIILNANAQLTEHIKWKAPSFCYQHDDRITFNLHGNSYFRLIFHCGAKVKASTSTSRLFEDSTGILEWITNDRAIATFADMEDVRSKETALKEVVHKWIACTSEQI